MIDFYICFHWDVFLNEISCLSAWCTIFFKCRSIFKDPQSLIWYANDIDSISGILTCSYCQVNISRMDLLHHCKTCLFMPRPNLNYKFVCCCCNYHTIRSEHMRCHLRKHTGEKPYKCKFFYHRSSQSYNLRKHMKIRHNF